MIKLNILIHFIDDLFKRLLDDDGNQFIVHQKPRVANALAMW